MLRLLVLLAALLTVQGQTTNVSQCTVNQGALPINTYIEGCITPPCVLPQLQDAVVHIVFKAPRQMISMRTLATAFMGIVPISYNLRENEETCNFLENTFCPIVEGELVQYTLKMPIEAFMLVGISVTVEFRVVDENNSAAMCIRVPVTIGPPVSSRIAEDQVHMDS